jgi:hypothetical protein
MLPLSLYARARTHFSIAHETAGAARTRHSLRPPVFEGGPLSRLGRVAPRDREVMCFKDVLGKEGHEVSAASYRSQQRVFRDPKVAGRQFGWS